MNSTVVPAFYKWNVDDLFLELESITVSSLSDRRKLYIHGVESIKHPSQRGVAGYMGSTPPNNLSSFRSPTSCLQSLALGKTTRQPRLSVSSSNIPAFRSASSASVAQITNVVR
ncbi:unnamed protein product [Periconia digitata]|uniref:Uncharacterized protein n=1 Tax=Periconia digitata TaxID=1303443 RepID=A0A9W4UBA1_9PLEO|nr:unnamed protein product [Periconia digitata]